MFLFFPLPHSGLGASGGKQDPYLLMPHGFAPLPSTASLYPAFPLYAMTAVGDSLSLSSFNTGLSPSFPSKYLIMAAPIVNLGGPVSPTPSVQVSG